MVRDARRPGGLIAACAAALALGVAGCGGDEGGGTATKGGTLEWVGKPLLYTPPELPRDRLLSGKLRNDSLRAIRLDADRARLVDADGKTVEGTVRFMAGFNHALYSPGQEPKEGDPEFERQRMGELAVVREGQTVPVTLSWRLPRGAAGPVRLEVGTAAIRLPASASGR